MTAPRPTDHDALATLRLIGPAPDDWVAARPGIDHNVLIVGGGQSGAAFSFALRRAGIGRVSVIDAAPEAAQAGVWLTRARMERLRTLKTLVGPELGLPALGFQRWYEAQHGQDAYAALERIPRLDWARYLAWYRDFLQIPVRYGVRLTRIEPADGPEGGHFRAHLEIHENGATHVRIETVRKIILANGVAGNGRPHMPDALAGLPPALHAHTAQAIDFAALRGKTVAVLGGAASAFDAAATALEAGAAHVHQFVRRKAIPALPVTRTRAYPGAYDNYPGLPDALRWSQALRFARAGSTPPADAVTRAVRFDNFHLHLGTSWTRAQAVGLLVETTVAGEVFSFDYVIAGTGYAVDLHARPELADFAGQVLLWRDHYQPAPQEQDAALGAHPYLGDALEYLEKTPGTAPYLRHIYVYNPAAFVSRGVPVGDVPGMRRDIPAIVRRISHDLLLDDLDAHAARMNADVPADFDETLYACRVWPGAVAGQAAAAVA